MGRRRRRRRVVGDQRAGEVAVMGFTYQDGSFYATGSGQTHNRKLAACGAASWLVEMTAKGHVMLPYTAVTLTTGQFPTYNLMAGIQVGAAGFTPVSITNGTGGAGNWITLANHLTPAFSVDNVVGSSGTVVMERVSYALDIDWHGTYFLQAAQDVYLSIGLDQGQPVATQFEPYYSYFVGIAS